MNTSSTSPRLHLLPVSLRTANVFVLAHHHRPVQAAKFALAVTLVDSDLIRGVAIVGRPVARHLDDGWTREVTRLCTDSTPNACSKLYGAAWQAAKSLGYIRLITYTLPDEGGASLRAAGWREDAPMLVVQKASWPGLEKIVRGTLADIKQKCQAEKIGSQAMIVASPTLGAADWESLVRSKLYDPTFTHRFRKANETITHD